MAKIVADQRARGGGKGRPVLIILISTMILLAIYMVTLLGWSGSQIPSNSGQTAAQPSSSANTSKVPTENPAYPSPAAPSSGGQGSAAPAR